MRARPITVTKEGAAIVPLSRQGKHEAIVNLEDYEFLLSLGVSPNWQVSGGSVIARTPEGAMLIGRILADAKAGQQVRYLDGNPFNLRRENLILKHGGFSLRNDRECLSRMPSA